MRYFRYFLTIVLIVVAFSVVYLKFKNVYYDIPALLKEANKPILLFLVIFQAVNYFGDAWLSKILLSVSGFGVGLKDTIKIAVLGVIGSHVAPFLGGTIVTFHSYKKLNIPSAVISFLVFSWSLFIWFPYFFFFLISLILLPGLFFNFIFLQDILIMIPGLILISAIFFFLFRKKGRYFTRFLNIFSKPITKFAKFFYKKSLPKPKFFERFFSDFHQCFDLLLKSKNKIPAALFSSLLFYIGDILTFYFAFLVFGFQPNLILLIFGYTISLVLTVFTIIPGTPGVLEASLIMVFIKLGFPAHVVFFSALLFRFFSYWLPLPIGVFFYWKLKRGKYEAE